jgi:hypothetical protein
MIVGNMEKFKGKGVVAFLDILGFSREIVSNWDREVDNPLDKVLELKKNIPTYPVEEYRKNQDEITSRRTYICRVQTISDSVVVSFGFDNNPKMGDIILGMICFFDAIAVIWRNTLEAGFTIRGAAAFGPIYWNEKEIIGPAFIDAYEGERAYAKTSRVIMCSSLNAYLKSTRGQGTTMWNSMMLRTLAKDIDGYVIVNPHKLYSDQEDKRHVIDIIIKLRDTAKGQQREKYAPLLACLDHEPAYVEATDLGNY